MIFEVISKNIFMMLANCLSLESNTSLSLQSGLTQKKDTCKKSPVPSGTGTIKVELTIPWANTLNHSSTISSKIDYEHCLVSNYHSEPGKLFDYLKNLSNSTSSNYPIFHNSKLVSILLNKKPRCYFNSVFTESDCCSSRKSATMLAHSY